MFGIIYKWQTLVGAAIGAMSPFLLWWTAEKIRRGEDHRKKLYFIEKLLVDQINNVLDAKKTIRRFVNIQLKELICHIQENHPNAFSIDYAFFPSFSIIPLSDEIHKINTNSVYIDNKLGKSCLLSKDFPYIIEGAREQFFQTIQLNRDMALKKINPPEIQKASYLHNIKEYKLMIEKDLLNNNFSIYLKVLVEALEAIKELRKVNLRKWRLKFDPKYRFFKNKKQYIEAKKNSYEKIEKYFEKIVKERLREIKK